MSRKNNIVLFEPWGLGDLFITLHAARQLHKAGYHVSLICKEKYVVLVKYINIIDAIYPSPDLWTRSFNKYTIRSFIEIIKYLYEIRNRLKRAELLCEIRGDIRNVIFLKYLRLAPVLSLIGKKPANRYDRPNYLLKKLGIEPIKMTGGSIPNKIENIACFFGAEWKNRQVPSIVAKKIVAVILEKKKYKINIIIQPNDEKTIWRDYANVENVNLYKGNLIEITQVIAKSDVCISTDTGWLHVASYLGIPQIGLFGFSTHQEWAPPDCIVVLSKNIKLSRLRYKKKYQDISPLSSLNVIDVINALEKLTQKGSLVG